MELLSRERIEEALADLDGWSYDGEALVKTYRYHDFGLAIEFVERVAEAAEERQHHPDIDIRYNKVTLHLVTHSAGGVTDADVELARGVDHLA